VNFVLPVITATATTVGANCGVSNGSATVSASGGTAPYTYTWSPAGGNAATASNLSSGAYTVLITDANGCTLTQPINVPAIGGPTLTLSNVVNASCGQTNGSATVNATGGTAPYSYAWSPTGGTGPTATGLAAGNYTITVTDNSGCIVSETAVIGGGSAITVNGTVIDENCGQSDGGITVSTTGGTAPFTFTWSPGGETTQNISNIVGGSYSVTVSDASGCSTTSTFEVEVVGSLPVSVNPSSATIEQGDTVQLTASGGLIYTWSPTTNLSCVSCDTLLASPSVTTTYEVTVTDANGCSGTAEVIVYVNPICSQEIFVPTIFSSNSDGKNDRQCVLGNCIATMTFSIYNWWGELVFETNDQNTCWDGTYKGKKVNSDVFVFKLNAILLNGKEVNQSGNLTVLH
jgi:gliding motility-associated-like protein